MLWRSHLLGGASYWALPWPGGDGVARPGAALGAPGVGAPRHLAMAWPGAAAARPWQRPGTGNAQ
jgi:hypothetical protein